MADEAGNAPHLEDPERQLERAFIDEFLRGRGHDVHTVQTLPAEERRRLLRDASIYACAKLSEVEARAHYVNDLRRHECGPAPA